jgi:hypothetical protein
MYLVILFLNQSCLINSLSAVVLQLGVGRDLTGDAAPQVPIQDFFLPSLDSKNSYVSFDAV